MTPAEDIDLLVADAEGGDPVAQNILGAKLATGEGVEQDVLGSVYWYGEAAKQGYAHSMWNVGSMLVDGENGLAAHRELGMTLIEVAANAGENSACLFLSNCYAKGIRGKPKDSEQAVLWDMRAWDYKSAREFTQGIDVRASLTIRIDKPIVKLSRRT